MNKLTSLLQYVSDIHLERGFKRNIYPKKPFILLGGDIGYPQENNYKELELDLINGGNSKLILSAMITNFQTRIDLLQDVLQQVEEIKNIDHENTII